MNGIRNLAKKMEARYWAKNPEWYIIDEEADRIVLTDKAPERARISLDMYLNPKKYGIDD